MSSGTISNATKTRKKMKKRKIVHSEGRLMIAKVYHFLKEEFAFTELYKEPNCDITHLRNITMRTAEATGVSERTVQKILKEERDMKIKKETGISTKSTKTETKEKKCEKETDDATASNVTTSSSQEETVSSTNNTESADKIIPGDKEKKRKVVHSEGREMIASIYYFLKGEYEVTDLYREPNTDYTHLRNITRRTAEAAGVSERTVQKVLKEERDLIKSGGADASSKLTKKTTKKGTTKKKEKENKKGRKKITKTDETGKSLKVTKKRGKKEKNVQNRNDSSTSSSLPVPLPVETNTNLPPPPPSYLHQAINIPMT